MTTLNTIRTITIRGTSEGLDKLTADLGRLAGAQENVAVVSEQSARRQLSLEQAWKKQTMQLDETARSQSRIAAATKVADGALREGLITQQQHAERLNLISQRYAVAEQQAGKFAKQTGLNRYEVLNLSRQLQDVGVSLAGGQSPFVVLTQQGSQILDVFQASRGSVSGFFSQIVAGASAVLTPLRLAVGGLVGIGTAAVTAAYEWDGAQKSIDRALIGVGQRSGATRNEINQIVAASAAASNISIGSARDIVLELVKSGGVYKENLKSMADVTRNFAIVSDQSFSEAAKDIGKAMSGDLVAAAERYNAQLGFLDGRTREYIRTLQNSNQEMRAQKVLVDQMAASVADATKTLGPFERLWNAMKANASANFNAIGKALSPGTDEEQRSDLVRQRSAAITTRFSGGVGPRAAAGLDQEIEKLNKQIDELDKKLKNVEQSQADAMLRKFSLADNAVRSLIPQIAQTEALTKAIDDLQRAQGNSGVSGKQGLSAANQEALNAAQLQKRLAEEAREQEARRVTATRQIAENYQGVTVQAALTLDRLKDQLSVAQAIGGRAKLDAQDEAKRAELIRQGRQDLVDAGVVEKQREVTNAQINDSYRERTRIIQQQNELLRAQLSGASDEEQARIRAAQVYRDAIRDGASHTEAAAAASATLQNGLLRAAQNAERMAAAMDRAYQAEFKAGVAAIGGTISEYGTVSSPYGGTPGISSLSGKAQGSARYDFSHLSPAGQAVMIGALQGNVGNLAQLQHIGKLVQQESDAAAAVLKAGQLSVLSAKGSASNLFDERTRTGFQIEALRLQQVGETNPFKRQEIELQIQDLVASLNKLTEATNANTNELKVGLSDLYSESGDGVVRGFYQMSTPRQTTPPMMMSQPTSVSNDNTRTIQVNLGGVTIQQGGIMQDGDAMRQTPEQFAEMLGQTVMRAIANG